MLYTDDNLKYLIATSINDKLYEEGTITFDEWLHMKAILREKYNQVTVSN